MGKIWCGVFVVGLAMPGATAALDCAVPSFKRDFWSAKRSPETYEVVFGHFANARNANHDRANDVATWDATFVGFRASAEGFDLPLTTAVRIEDYLFSEIAGGGRAANTTDPWMENLEGVVFLRQSPDGYVISTNLCSPFIYTEAENIAQALSCVNGRQYAEE